MHDRVELRRQLRVESRRSPGRSCACRLRSNVTVPASACSISVLTSSWARSGSVCLVRRNDLIEQVRRAGSGRCGGCGGDRWARSEIAQPSCLGDAELARQRLQLVLVLQDLLEQALELFGAVDLAHQVAQLVARLEQRLQRRNLLGDPGRLEILDRIEFQLHRHLAAVIGELVGHPDVEPRRHPGHHVIEIVAVDLDELALRERAQRLRSDRRRNRP